MVPGITYNRDQSLIDAVYDIIEAETAMPAEERIKLRKEVVELAKNGMIAVQQALKAYQIKVARSVEMQTRTSTLFPHLLGQFTKYCNETQWAPAIEATKERLGNAITTLQGGVFNLVPAVVHEAIVKHHTKANLSLISDVEWYEMGAPIGMFNIYTQEYDAESHALWITCPEEFVQMYRRAGQIPNADRMTEVLNQATYVGNRGINQVKIVPRYV